MAKKYGTDRYTDTYGTPAYDTDEVRENAGKVLEENKTTAKTAMQSIDELFQQLSEFKKIFDLEAKMMIERGKREETDSTPGAQERELERTERRVKMFINNFALNARDSMVELLGANYMIGNAQSAIQSANEFDAEMRARNDMSNIEPHEYAGAFDALMDDLAADGFDFETCTYRDNNYVTDNDYDY